MHTLHLLRHQPYRLGSPQTAVWGSSMGFFRGSGCRRCTEPRTNLVSYQVSFAPSHSFGNAARRPASARQRAARHSHSVGVRTDRPALPSHRVHRIPRRVRTEVSLRAMTHPALSAGRSSYAKRFACTRPFGRRRGRATMTRDSDAECWPQCLYVYERTDPSTEHAEICLLLEMWEGIARLAHH